MRALSTFRADSPSEGSRASDLNLTTGGARQPDRPARAHGTLAKLRALSWPDRWLLVEAVPYLAVARLLVLTVPFARLAGWWGLREGEAPSEAPPSEAPPPKAPPPGVGDLPARIGLAVARVAGRTPWRSTCLAQALAAAAMLHRRHIPATLYLGARRDQAEGLTAHAWLRVGPTIITGGGIHQQYGVVGVFSNR